MTSFFGSPIIVMIGVGASAFIIMYLYAEKIISWLRDQSLGNREYVIQRLDLMFVEINKRRVTGAMLMLSFGFGALVLALFWPNVVVGLVAGMAVTVLGWRLPKLLVDVYYNQRASKFVDQLVDGLTLMSSGLKSGLSVPQAMKLVSDNMPNPIAQEFELMLSQNALGVSLEEVFNDLAKRITYPDVQMFVTSVNILKETGGNIAETFDTMTRTIRERIKVEKKISAVTAQGVTQGIILTFLPFALLLIFLVIDPNYVSPLFNKTLGWIILLAIVILQIIGGLVIRKIVKIKV